MPAIVVKSAPLAFRFGDEGVPLYGVNRMADIVAPERETPGTSGVRWIVDPIDGTRSFSSGVPLYGVLIALEVEGVPVMGCCHLPALAETVVAALRPETVTGSSRSVADNRPARAGRAPASETVMQSAWWRG